MDNKNNRVEHTRGGHSLYGLVLAGGHSNRMKTDKSLLAYHGKSQVQHCFDLITPYCLKVFVSNREDQSLLDNHKDLPQIHDTFLNIGPLGGILSAMASHSHVAWLILACDLPFVNSKTIEKLIKFRDPSKIATAYKSTTVPFHPEPLCSIYEPRAHSLLLKFYQGGKQCPRKFLINSDVRLIKQDDQHSLTNINSIHEYQAAMNALQTQRNE